MMAAAAQARNPLEIQLFGPRALMDDSTLIDMRIGADMGAVFAQAGVVYAADLLRLGWTPSQIEAFQTRWAKGEVK
ncbi:hypothetical protein [Methylocella sp.]|uniref:hypothetical protein n=1 Tax=Methylocella sp. TaxID=1978226 RepID=UPI0035B48D1C